MREIEFKGKEKKTGKWIEGQRCTNGREIWIVYDEDFCKSTSYKEDELTAWRFEEIDPETIGQYTGLKDKNGVKIFEGDILSENNRTAVVIWGDSFDSPARFLTSRTLSPKDICIGNTRWDMCEVIGNYHDNPELLKEADNA